jgi:N-acetylmuramoyl-L-alanine amidase
VLNLAPFLQTGTTMVPIRFVSEVLGATVVWDGATKTVSIFFPGS